MEIKPGAIKSRVSQARDRLALIFAEHQDRRHDPGREGAQQQRAEQQEQQLVAERGDPIFQTIGSSRSDGALAFVPGLPSISLNPELALVLFLPPC